MMPPKTMYSMQESERATSYGLQNRPRLEFTFIHFVCWLDGREAAVAAAGAGAVAAVAAVGAGVVAGAFGVAAGAAAAVAGAATAVAVAVGGADGNGGGSLKATNRS
jgi:hypothetical protein